MRTVARCIPASMPVPLGAGALMADADAEVSRTPNAGDRRRFSVDQLFLQCPSRSTPAVRCTVTALAAAVVGSKATWIPTLRNSEIR